MLILSTALSVLTFIKGGVTIVSEIIVALIGGLVTLSGVLIANSKAQAVTDAKLEALTHEVREVTKPAQQVPVMAEQIRVINHRIRDLEEEAQHATA